MRNVNSIKKALIMTLGVVMAFALSLAAMFAPAAPVVKAESKSISEITFSMVDGAKASVASETDKHGLKFAASLSAADYEGIMSNENYSDIQFGMFIVPQDYVDVYALTEENLFGKGETQSVYDWAIFDGSDWVYSGSKIRIMNIYANQMLEGDDGNFYHEGAITTIKDANIARDFVGKAYIRYTENETVKYLLADSNDNVRSIAYVAQVTLANPTEYPLEDEQKDWMTTNYINKSVVDLTNKDYAYVDLSNTADYVFAVDGTATRITTADLSSVPFTAGENTITLANALVKQGLAKGENVIYIHTKKVVDNKLVFGVQKITLVAADMVIADGAEFQEFIQGVRKATAATYAGKYIVLSDDITGAAGGHYDMVNSSATGFAGTFDGRYHTVYGGTWGQAGMFGYINDGATVKNLNVVAPVIKWGYSGVIATYVAGTCENINVVVNAALSTSTATMTNMPETGLLAYGLKTTAVIKNVDVYRYDAADAARNCSLWYTKSGTTVASNSGNDAYTKAAWTNKGAAIATDRALVETTISGVTEIATTAADGAKVSLVNGLGVKVDAGVTVQNGKIVLDSANISAETFGTYTFFIEIENARGDIFIPAILA